MALDTRDDPSPVDQLLEQGLALYGANRVEHAVACWRQVLELVPDEPRALDYLSSAGHPLAEGTGQGERPVGPELVAPPASDAIEVVEVAPISHHTGWRPAAGERPASRPSRRRRTALLLPWAVIALMVPLVGYLLFAQMTETLVRDEPQAVAPAPPARPAPVVRELVETPAPPQPATAPAAADETYVVSLTVVPRKAVIVMDGQRVARGEYIARVKRDGTAHTVEISAPKYQTRELTFVDEAPPRRVRLIPARDRAVRRGKKAQRAEAERAKAPAAPATGAPAAPSPVRAPTRTSDNIDPWADSP